MHHPHRHECAHDSQFILHTQRFFGSSSESMLFAWSTGSLRPPRRPPHPHTNRTALTHHSLLMLPPGVIFQQPRRLSRTGGRAEFGDR